MDANQCTVEGCLRPTRSGHSPYCHTHYERLRTTGSLGSAEIRAHTRRKPQPSYYNAHHAVLLAKGPATGYLCPCGRPAHHWAYDHEDPGEVLDERGYAYSLSPDHHIAMCRSCHKRFDNWIRRL